MSRNWPALGNDSNSSRPERLGVRRLRALRVNQTVRRRLHLGGGGQRLCRKSFGSFSWLWMRAEGSKKIKKFFGNRLVLSPILVPRFVVTVRLDYPLSEIY